MAQGNGVCGLAMRSSQVAQRQPEAFVAACGHKEDLVASAAMCGHTSQRCA